MNVRYQNKNHSFSCIFFSGTTLLCANLIFHNGFSAMLKILKPHLGVVIYFCLYSVGVTQTEGIPTKP